MSLRSISSKLMIVGVLSVIFTVTALGEFGQFDDSSGEILTDQNEYWQIPQHQDQSELLTELVAPFLFISIILQLVYGKVLAYILRDEVETPYGMPYYDDNKPKVRKYSVLLAVTTSLALIPTPFWDYIIYSVVSVPVIATAAVVLIVVWGSYNVIRSLG